MAKRIFYDFLEDYNVRNELDRLAGVLDSAIGFHAFPMYRLAPKYKHTKFCLELLEVSDTELRNERNRRYLVTKGLKSHEKNLVLEYIKNVGYNLPLEEGKSYTWKQVKQLLTEKIGQM